ncbi:MAG: PilC/PilY family type IV pilus protein [Woeseiaceae bacterium]
MNTRFKNTTGTVLGLLLTLLAGAPALADDTELLLVDPNNVTPKPNIMFIIDSSGSMTTQEQTSEPYDTAAAYAGTCDPNMLYWNEIDTVPTCEASNTQMIAKSSFLCEKAAKQLEGIGVYADTMVQYRTGSSGFFSIFLGLDQPRWQKLEPGNTTAPVECKKDRGKHSGDVFTDSDGDGVDDDNFGDGGLFPQAGGGVEPYTANASNEISWRSWPTNQSVTVYDNNYLNYRESPVTIDESHIGIVQTTAGIILNSIEGVNVGIMRFNNERGGPVIQEMTDLDTNRTAIIDAINSIVADGFTPVAEASYESALYWSGLPAWFGEEVNEHTTAPGALASTNPEVYQQPAFDPCAKNYNVILTDGAPTNDVEAAGLVDTLPGWFQTLGHTGCIGTGDGDCLDDIAEYLYNQDIAPNQPGLQNVTTHTIGFALDLPILQAAAAAGGGEYFQADDIESLSLALMRIFTNINEDSLSFAAPAVAVNSFNRTQNFNDLYLTTFQASEKTHWPGNLKKYRIADGQIVDLNGVAAVDPTTGFFRQNAQSYWSVDADGNEVIAGGAANALPDPAVRNVYTNITANTDLTAATNALATSNADTFDFADLGLTGSLNEPTKEQVIDFARGVDVTDEDNDPTTTVRNVMGDPLHSQPAAVVYGGDAQNPEVVVYTATNDGYVHAIDGATGEELWAFVPMEHLMNLTKLFFNPESAYKNYGVDGDIVPVVKDVDNDGVIESADGDFVIIIFGMRRGGDSYYALDVTNKNSPSIKWRISSPEMGQSWSAPTVARIAMDDNRLNADEAVVIIGGGYDTVHDTIGHPASADGEGAGIYFLDLHSGEVLWRAAADGGADLILPTMTRAIPNQVRVVDFNGDSYADRMYASDLGGQIWRFDIFNGNAPNGIGPDALVTGGVIAQLGAEGLGNPTDVDTRRFYNAPDVAIFNDNLQNRRFLAINIGSGYRAHPLDNTNADRFYSIRDADIFNRLSQSEYDNYSIVTDSSLTEVSGTVGTVIGPNDRGWKLTLPADQKVLATSTTFNNEVFFVAFSPDDAAASTCSAGRGRNYLYRVAIANGDPIADLDNVVPGMEDQLRVQDLAQGGIAPSPRFLFPSPDDANCAGADCNPPPLGCIGVECFDPGFVNNPVRTLWTQDGIE